MIERSVAATWSGSSRGPRPLRRAGSLADELAHEAAGADLVLGGLKALGGEVFGPAQTGGDA